MKVATATKMAVNIKMNITKNPNTCGTQRPSWSYLPVTDRHSHITEVGVTMGCGHV
jgi:hypothetical protein